MIEHLVGVLSTRIDVCAAVTDDDDVKSSGDELDADVAGLQLS